MRSLPQAPRAEFDELRSALDKERRDLAEQRTLLETERAGFEEDLGVLEEQRRFLDSQREKIRQEAAALEARTKDFAHGKAVVAARESQRLRIENTLAQARQSLETEARQLKSEMAEMLRPAASRANRPSS